MKYFVFVIFIEIIPKVFIVENENDMKTIKAQEIKRILRKGFTIKSQTKKSVVFIKEEEEWIVYFMTPKLIVDYGFELLLKNVNRDVAYYYLKMLSVKIETNVTTSFGGNSYNYQINLEKNWTPHLPTYDLGGVSFNNEEMEASNYSEHYILPRKI